MKKYSDYFSCFRGLKNLAVNRLAATVLFMVAIVTMGFAQEPYVFTEGSVHKFAVHDNPANKFAWSMYQDPYADLTLDPSSYDLMDGGQNANLTIRFNDMGRTNAELVYLVVRETSPNGCSTRRAIQIQLEPNNMYLEFALAEAQDCYNTGDYLAPLRVGLNFKNKALGGSIPQQNFPLTLSYTVRNLTEGTDAVVGNNGNPVTVEFASDNNYSLVVNEAVGKPDRTTDYELVITTVKDKYDTEISDNPGDTRTQRRVIIHLPQSGKMDMAMALAYVITTSEIEYLGVN